MNKKSSDKPAAASANSVIRHKKFAVNLTSNLGNFALSLIVGFWFTPYLIKHLGVANYGLIPLATAVVSYMSIFTLSMNSSVARFLALALNQGKSNEASRYFNTAFFSLLALATLMLVAVLTATFYIDKILKVPAGTENQVRLLFGLAGVAFLINAVVAPLSVPAFSCNRLELQSFVSIAQTLSRVGFTIVAFHFLSPDLWQVGCGLLISASISVVGGILIQRHLAPDLRLRPSDFSWDTLRSISSTSFWVFLTQAGTILFLSIDLLVINRLMGPVANGKYAAVLQWTAVLRGLAGTVAGVFTPILLAHFAQGDHSALVKDTRRAIKFMGIFIALPIGLICGFAKPLLTLWLGKGFTELAPLAVLMVAPLSINLAIMPLFAIALAQNGMRLPGIISLVSGGANLILALVLCGPVGWGMYGVAAAGALILTAKNLIYMPVFTAKLIHQPWHIFYREMETIVVATLVIALLSWGLSRWIALTSWPVFLAAAAITSGLYGLYAYGIALSSEERGIVLKMAKSSFRRS